MIRFVTIAALVSTIAACKTTDSSGVKGTEGMAGTESSAAAAAEQTAPVQAQEGGVTDAGDQAALGAIASGTWQNAGVFTYSGGSFGQAVAWNLNYPFPMKIDRAALKYSSSCSFDNLSIKKLTTEQSAPSALEDVTNDGTWKRAIFTLNGGDPVSVTGLQIVIDGQPYSNCALTLFVHKPQSNSPF